MRHRPAGPNRGSPGRLVRWPWRVARTIRHGGPSRVVPMRQPRITGYGGRRACCVITRARRSTPKAVGRVSFESASRARNPERSAQRGSCGASLQTPRAGRRRIRRTCGATGDKPVARAERPNRPARDRAASVSRDAEARGSIVTPAFRAPSFFRERAMRTGLRANPAPAKQYGRRSVGYGRWQRSCLAKRSVTTGRMWPGRAMCANLTGGGTLKFREEMQGKRRLASARGRRDRTCRHSTRVQRGRGTRRTRT